VKRPNQAHFGVTLSSKNLFFSKNLALLWPRFINRLFINLLSSVQGPQRSCKKDLKSEKTQSSLLFFSPGCTMHIQSIILALYLNAAHTVTIFILKFIDLYCSQFYCTLIDRPSFRRQKARIIFGQYQTKNGHCVCSIKIKC
jgi:hypothetical protein